MRTAMNGVAMGIVLAFLLTQGAAAQGREKTKSTDDYPYSIMTPEPGQRAKPRRPARGVERDSPREEIERTEPPEPGQKPKRRTLGSGGSPLPPPRSIVTPLGIAPRAIETPAVGQIPAVPTPVPGFATVPPPPASLGGQSFPDKAIGCVQHGTSSGVGAGEIGAYTGSCVNTR